MKDNEDLHGFGQRQKNVHKTERVYIVAEEIIIEIIELCCHGF
jgi:hypothetical protein